MQYMLEVFFYKDTLLPDTVVMVLIFSHLWNHDGPPSLFSSICSSYNFWSIHPGCFSYGAPQSRASHENLDIGSLFWEMIPRNSPKERMKQGKGESLSKQACLTDLITSVGNWSSVLLETFKELCQMNLRPGQLRHNRGECWGVFICLFPSFLIGQGLPL